MRRSLPLAMAVVLLFTISGCFGGGDSGGGIDQTEIQAAIAAEIAAFAEAVEDYDVDESIDRMLRSIEADIRMGLYAAGGKRKALPCRA